MRQQLVCLYFLLKKIAKEQKQVTAREGMRRESGVLCRLAVIGETSLKKGYWKKTAPSAATDQMLSWTREEGGREGALQKRKRKNLLQDWNSTQHAPSCLSHLQASDRNTTSHADAEG